MHVLCIRHVVVFSGEIFIFILHGEEFSLNMHVYCLTQFLINKFTALKGSQFYFYSLYPVRHPTPSREINALTFLF